MTNALELLKSSATTGYVGGDAVERFIGKVNVQIGYANSMKDGTTVSPRSLWFKRQGDGYIVAVSRNRMEIAGSKLFKAADLDGVVAVLKAAIEVIGSDDKLKHAIIKQAETKTAQLKAGRAKGKAK